MSVNSAMLGSASQSGCGQAQLAEDPVDHAPVGVEQRAPHEADHDGREQHGQDEDAAHEPRCRAGGGRRTARAPCPGPPGWRRRRPTRIAVLTDRLPEDRVARARSLVVVQPDERERAGRLAPVEEADAQAVEQREDREHDQVERRRARRAAGRPAACAAGDRPGCRGRAVIGDPLAGRRRRRWPVRPPPRLAERARTRPGPAHSARCPPRLRIVQGRRLGVGHRGRRVLGAGEREVDLARDRADDLERLGDVGDLEDLGASRWRRPPAGMYGSAATISGSEPVEVRLGSVW